MFRLNSNLNLSNLVGDNEGFRKDAGFWNSLRFGLILNVNLNDQDQSLNREGDYQNRIESNDNSHQQRKYNNIGDHKDFTSKFTITDGWYSLEQRVRSFLKTQNNLVEDFTNGNYMNNINLTYYSNFRQNEYETSLGTNRVIWTRNLHGRSNSRLSFDAKLAYQITEYSNESNLDYRNIRSNFNHPKVSFNIHHSFNKTSSYSILSDIQYFNTKEFPQADQQMVGIYDDILPGYRFLGANKDLKLASINNYFGQINFNENNTFGFVANLKLNYKSTTNSFSDSILYEDNEQINYVIQIKDPVQQLNFTFNMAKPFNLSDENKLTTKFTTKSIIFRRIQFIGDEMQKMQNAHQNYDLSIYYSTLNKLQIGILNALNLYNRYDLLNEERGNSYSSKDFNTGISASYSPLKDLVIGSNLMSRHVNSNINTDHAVIWNANISYRMLKGDNLEIKLAAYDLLNQNKAIYIVDTPTEVTSGLKNSLNQYFMLTVSFMPRKFGK